jgi:DNA-binding CsgD family transcriptional regulator
VRLTPRQRQVAALVEAGLTNQQIGHRLGISARTVRKHLEDIFELTGATSRTQVAVWWRYPTH